MNHEEWNKVENKELINSYCWEITEWLIDHGYNLGDKSIEKIQEVLVKMYNEVKNK